MAADHDSFYRAGSRSDQSMQVRITGRMLSSADIGRASLGVIFSGHAATFPVRPMDPRLNAKPLWGEARHRVPPDSLLLTNSLNGDRVTPECATLQLARDQA